MRDKRLVFICQFLQAGVLAGLFGCIDAGPSVTHVRWHNESSDTIWVDKVKGFNQPIECGVLVPKKDAGLSGLRPLSLPKKATVSWVIEEGNDKGERQSTELDLSDLKPSAAEDMLVFTFRPDHTWTVEIIRNPYGK